MDDNDGAVLREIRDLQREHLAEYKRVTERSLALQEKAVARQEQFSRLYRRVIAALALLVVAGIILVLYSFSR
jgi:hypothetical protein